MKVPLLDLAAQYGPLQADIESATLKVLREGRYVLGPEVAQLETELAKYIGAKHVVGCASGSDALLLALMALGIGVGDEVITTPFTFFATVSAITRLGAKPVLVDIDPATFNIQVSGLRSRVSSRTKAIIPVHLFGQCADMEPILALGIPVVEDACQAIGARTSLQCSVDSAQRANRPPSTVHRPATTGSPSHLPLPASPSSHWLSAGAIGTIGTFSFYPTKNLGGPGDGGALSTNDDALATRLRQLRNHGMEPRYHHAYIGINSRLDTLQAAVLLAKLKHLDAWTEGRRRNAALYNELLKDITGIVLPCSDLRSPSTVHRPLSTAPCPLSPVHRPLPPSPLPLASSRSYHVFNQYTIRVPKRDALRTHLQAQGIGTEIYYPVPLHLQPCFAFLGYRAGDFPESEKAAAEVLSLPIYPELTGAQIEFVVRSIADFFHRG